MRLSAIFISAFFHLAVIAFWAYPYFFKKNNEFEIKKEVLYVLKTLPSNTTSPSENSNHEPSQGKGSKNKIDFSSLKKHRPKSNASNSETLVEQSSRLTMGDSPIDRITLSSETITSLLSENTRPIYPRIAQAKRLEGQVVIRAKIDQKTLENGGSASFVEIAKTSGHSILDNSALKAVKSWVFKPAELSTLKSLAGEKSLLIPIRFALLKGTSSDEND